MAPVGGLPEAGSLEAVSPEAFGEGDRRCGRSEPLSLILSYHVARRLLGDPACDFNAAGYTHVLGEGSAAGAAQTLWVCFIALLKS